MSIGLSVQEKFKIDFQDSRHSTFWIGTILAIFDQQIAMILSTKSTGLSVQEKFKTDFQDGSHGGHLGFRIGTILAIFDLQVTQILSTKF